MLTEFSILLQNNNTFCTNESYVIKVQKIKTNSYRFPTKKSRLILIQDS